jgi:hypothetical protein
MTSAIGIPRLVMMTRFFCLLTSCKTERHFALNSETDRDSIAFSNKIISDQQQSWGYEEGLWKGPGSAGGR